MTRDPLGGGERCSQDWRATEPYCNSVTPETGCHRQDPHFHRAIFLTQRLNTRRTWPRCSWGHTCHSQKLCFPWELEGAAESTGQPTPSAHPPAAVPCLVHTTVLPGAQLWGTLFPRTCSWPCSRLHQKEPHHLPETWKSYPEPRLFCSPPAGASALEGSAALSLPGCCALALHLQD